MSETLRRKRIRRESAAVIRARRLKGFGTEKKATGTNRVVGGKVMTTGYRSGQSVDGRGAHSPNKNAGRTKTRKVRTRG
jgi:hypothetical protein